MTTVERWLMRTTVRSLLCTFSAFTALEIVAITLLVVGIIANSGRFVQYVVKTLKKRSLRATEAEIKRDEEIKRKCARNLS